MYVTLLTRLRDIYFIINGPYGFSGKEDSRKSNTEEDDFDSLYKQEEAENNVVIIFHSYTVYTGIESILLLFDLTIFFPNH
jgi:hypothetical protein